MKVFGAGGSAQHAHTFNTPPPNGNGYPGPVVRGFRTWSTTLQSPLLHSNARSMANSEVRCGGGGELEQAQI